jgi:hypothetical protein
VIGFPRWAGAFALVAVLLAVALAGCSGGSSGGGAPPGAPSGLQLRELLPATRALPAGWHVAYAPVPASHVQAGTEPPAPVAACYDFNTGFDLGAAGDSFVSLASETAYKTTAGNGRGMLRIDLFGVLPGDAARAISAVKPWVGRCSSYTDGPITYAVTAAPVPGLGDQSLDVRVTPTSTGAITVPVDGLNTLVVRVGNDLIAIECVAPPGLLLSSLSSIAAPLARRLPSASSLAVTALPPSPGGRPSGPAPVLRPSLTGGELQALLPPASALPGPFAGAAVNDSSSDAGPAYQTPAPLPCGKLPGFETEGFVQDDANIRSEADLETSDSHGDQINVWLAEPTTPALTSADYDSLRELAGRCHRLEYVQETFRTTVVPVPGVGNAAFYVRMRPVAGISAGGLGEQAIVLARVGNDALVMIACNMSPGDPAPSLIPLARSLARKL